MRVALDVHSGDNGPIAVIDGARQAIAEYGVDITLVGNEAEIDECIEKLGCSKDIFDIRHASQIITMEDDPMEAVRRKKDASMILAIKMVKDKEADAMLTAGSTGAIVAAGPIVAGRIKGILRPALATPIPGAVSNGGLLLDIGANPECTGANLVQFAVIGSAYSEGAFGIKKPKVALLNNGVESHKGRKEFVEAYSTLSEMKNVNFIGNIEGRDILSGIADVIVTDGFTGNIALKTLEGCAKTFMSLVKDAAMTNLPSKIGAGLLKSSLKKSLKKIDYLEYGGAPLVGIDGLLLKAHGSSDAKGIKNAIRVANEAAKRDTIEIIRAAVSI